MQAKKQLQDVRRLVSRGDYRDALQALLQLFEKWQHRGSEPEYWRSLQLQTIQLTGRWETANRFHQQGYTQTWEHTQELLRISAAILSIIEESEDSIASWQKRQLPLLIKCTSSAASLAKHLQDELSNDVYIEWVSEEMLKTYISSSPTSKRYLLIVAEVDSDATTAENQELD
ncbi:MAG: hypothetical protein AAF135_11475 [Bacteroidota bacterium]